MLKIEKTVHCQDKIEQFKDTPLPETVILGDLLKSLESRLQHKGLLPPFTGQFNPLWFEAETERNLFLWRQGRSLTELDQFEFWIDVPRLIERRLEQLNEGLEGVSQEQAISAQSLADERRYLQMLLDLVAQAAGHIHALSHVGSKIRQEVGLAKQRVILPAR